MIQGISILLGAPGRWLLIRLNAFLDLFGFMWRILTVLAKQRKKGRLILRKFTFAQVYFTGIQALGTVSIVSLIMGGLIIIQSIAQLGVKGSEQLLGTLLTVIVIREVGPMMTALIIILRSGTAVSVEIGYMSEREEIQAIEMMGINPLHLLAIPRILGITMATICLFIYFDIVAIFGGWFLCWLISGLELSTFLNILGCSITRWDLAVGVVKGFFFGLTISAICLLQGFSVKKSITEVPQVTAKAAVQSLIYCVVLDIIISLLFYL